MHNIQSLNSLRPYNQDSYSNKQGLLAEDPIDRSQGGHAFGAYYNIVCAVCGTGMLGLSQAIARGGWGAIALLLLAWWMVSVSLSMDGEVVILTNSNESSMDLLSL